MFEIGKIVKPQGIRGELRIYPTTDDPERFGLLKEVFLRHNNTETKYTIENARVQKGMVILTLREITNRNQAEALVGGTLHIPEAWALPLDEDEYYVRDLIGLATQDEDGATIGEIIDVLHTGANDVYIIKPTVGESFMVPAIKEVVRNVSIKEGIVTLRLLDGLRELTTRKNP